MSKERFRATIVEGHKAAACEVPFDPTERWSIDAQTLRPGRRGHRVTVTIGRHSFESEIVPVPDVSG